MVTLSPAPRRLPSSELRVGYVPLTDSAPLLVAEEKRLFEKHGLRVRLSAEPGWATIREKLTHGELDAAHCLAGLALALNYGLECVTQPVIVPLILSSNGNAITISKDLDPSVFSSGERLDNFLENEWQKDRPLTLAAVHPFSSHYYLLRSWLNRLQCTRQDLINFIFLPPPVLSRNLASGTLDGFCVGEPWNSKSILREEGWCAATSVELDDGHPEKVLVVPRCTAEQRPREVVALTAALLEACRLCQDDSFHPTLAALLESQDVFGMKASDLGASLKRQTLQPPHTSRSQDNHRFHLFFGEEVNAPHRNTANRVVSALRAANRCGKAPLKELDDIFRLDFYNEALAATKCQP